MDFDWINPAFDFKESFFPKEIEESFEDPFSLRLSPDAKQFTGNTRFFCIGRSVQGKGIFSIYKSNGNQARVITSRPFSPEEDHFYERKKQENL